MKYKFRAHIVTHWSEFFLGLAVIVLFILQVWNLRASASPLADESTHAEIGRAMMDGFLPYRDVYYPHPPLLALIIGAGLRVFGSMYPLNILYLLLNLLSVFPLQAVLRKISNDRTGAFFGSLFTLTYHELVHHDFRMFALRPLSNVLLIFFLFVGLYRARWKWRLYADAFLVSCSALLFLPGFLNLGLAALFLTVQESTRTKKIRALRHYALAGTVAASLLLLLFVSLPGSFDQIVMEHLGLEPFGRLARLDWVSSASWRDIPFYVASVAALVGSLFVRRLRAAALCMLAMVALLFVPGEFWPHYVVIAAVAFAAGIAFLPAVLRAFLPKPWHPAATHAIAVLLGVHLCLTLPSVLTEWRENKQPEYDNAVLHLSQAPEPVLTFMEPGYAIDADRTLVHHFYQSTRFLSTLRQEISEEEIRALAEQACSIFLTDWDRGFVKDTLVDEWREQYQTVFDQDGLLLLATGHQHCIVSP